MDQKLNLCTRWHKLFKKATDFDSWGQLVEAKNEYTKLAKQIRSSVSTSSQWEDDTKKTLLKIASCLECRAKLLQSVNGQEEFTLKDVRRIDPVFQGLTTTGAASSVKHGIPIDLYNKIDVVRKRNAITTPSPELVSLEEEEEGKEEVLFTSQIDTLLPKLPMRPGISLVTVNIVKVGLKNASDYIDPFFQVSCKDSIGLDLCRTQNTPCCTSKADTYLHFNTAVELQMPLEEMNRGTAVYFEMMHYKPKRRTTATKCYAFMEVDELKSGPCVIELYKKPIDYRRKKLTLLTSKPLYLHLALTITSE